MHALESGTFLLAKGETVSTTRYWSLPPLPRLNIDLPRAEALLEEKITDTVTRSMSSLKNVACLLSGSLNSSALLSYSRKLRGTGQTLTSYTLSRLYSTKREHRLAIEVARLCQVENVEIWLPEDPISHVRKLAAAMDSPSGHRGLLRFFLLTTSSEIRCDGVLGGFGGDELFAGRPYHQMLNFPKPLNLLPHFLKKLLINDGTGVGGMPQNALDAYELWTENFTEDQTRNLLISELSSSPARQALGPSDSDSLRQFLDMDIMHRLPDLFLPALDRFARSGGLELRLPFLDRELVELVALLPRQFILNGLTQKFLLRRLLQKRMPPRVLHQIPRGRDFTFRRWIDIELRDLIYDSLTEARSLSSEFLSRRELASMLSKHYSGDTRVWGQLWSLLTLELWHKGMR